MIVYNKKQFNVLCQDEIDDYINVLNRHHYTESEFSISENDITDYSNNFYIPIGEAIVKKINGKEIVTTQHLITNHHLH